MRWLVLVVLAAAGCLNDDLVPCGDLVCAAGQVCAGGNACVEPDQVAACAGLSDGAACTPVTSAPGTCHGGACVQFCGDGAVEGAEQCDDGNQNPADGCDACAFTAWNATAIIGGNATATAIGLEPAGVAVDHAGNIYFTDATNNVVRRIDAATDVTTLVAGGGPGPLGDGGAATDATLSGPGAIAVDGLGNVFVGDGNNHRVRRIDAATGIITTVAGNGTYGASGDGGPATSAELGSPSGLAVDGLGNLFIADGLNDRVRRVDVVTGIIATIAGTTYGFAGDGGQATSAKLYGPAAVALDPQGRIVIADQLNERIRRVDPTTGIITTIAGSEPGGYAGDGGPATNAQLFFPAALGFDAQGDLFIADSSNNVIRRIDAATGIITTSAGTGIGGFAGDGGAATVAELYQPTGVAIDRLGNVFIADLSNSRLRRVDAAGAISTIAGDGQFSESDDGSAATSVAIGVVGSSADAAGNVFIADVDNNRIRRVDAVTGVITTVVGNTTMGFTGDGGLAVAAELKAPRATAFDALGNLFIADTGNNRIRRVDVTTGVITTYAGNGTGGYTGGGGQATSAELEEPQSMVFDGAGNLFIVDDATIRRVDATTHVITTVAGNGTPGYGGDHGAATSAELHLPTGVAVDATGDILIADTGNHRIRRVDATTHVITTIAGNGTDDDTGDGGPATSAELFSPGGVTVDAAGNIIIADTGNSSIRRIDASTQVITTVIGDKAFSFDGDGGPAANAHLDEPSSVLFDAQGDMIISGGSHVRRVDGRTGIITTVAGAVEPAGMGPIAQAQLADPRALVAMPGTMLVAGGATGTIEAITATVVSVVAGRYAQGAPTGQLARFRDSTFGSVGGVAYDAARGMIYISETGTNRVDAVTIVDATNADTWTIAPLANAAGATGFADGPAATAKFRAPGGLALDGGTLYVADTGNHVVRAIDLATATVSTIAGTPATIGFDGDGRAATTALLYQPQAIAKCGTDLFIADTGNDRIRRVDANGTITTVLGDGIADSSGNGGPASTFPIDSPLGLVCDARGDIYATSGSTVRELPANDAGIVDGTGIVLTIYGALPRDAFPANVTRCLTGIALVDDATLQVADSCTGLLVQLQRQ